MISEPTTPDDLFALRELASQRGHLISLPRRERLRALGLLGPDDMPWRLTDRGRDLLKGTGDVEPTP
jgi:hypothetical protein